MRKNGQHFVYLSRVQGYGINNSLKSLLFFFGYL